MSETGDDPDYDESEHSKEVYAYFGLAYYQSGVIESGIANALLYGEFLPGWKARIEQEGKTNFDRKVYEAEFDAYLESRFAQSMGNLIARLDRVYTIPVELKQVIKEGKALRDFLAHHFFRERATDFVTRAGRDRMIAELNGMVEKFHDMDVRIQRLTEPVMRDLGIRDDVLQRLMEDFKRKAHAGEPI
jgi:hypothetical protein